MNKLVLVTGASRGIGRAIAELFATQGYCVIGTATSQAGADSISAHLQPLQSDSCGMVVNIAEADSITALMENIKTQFDTMPAILINNAGIVRDGLMLRMKADDWQSVLHTNLTGTFSLSQACLKSMVKARWGRIINIGSVVASMGNAGQVNYCAAKAGIEGFSRALAKEVGSRGITINTVAPGFIHTDMTDALDDAQRDSMHQQIPLKRMGTPQEIAHAVAFLASEDASYITGITLPVNGGMYLG